MKDTQHRIGRGAAITAAATLTVTACGDGDGPALTWTPEPTSILTTDMTHREARQALAGLAHQQGAVEVPRAVSSEWQVTVPTRIKVTVADDWFDPDSTETHLKDDLCLTAAPDDVRVYEQEVDREDPMCDPTSADAWWQLQSSGKWKLIEADEPRW